MQQLIQIIEQGPVAYSWIALALAFVVLAKCADLFVESSVEIAERFHIPKLVIGIVLVSLATTAPELSVSMMSALHGRPEMALGNAIGSVICNSGLALALCAILSPRPIPVQPAVLKTTGGFLLFVCIMAFFFTARDFTLTRPEGSALVVLFVGYLGTLFWQHRQGKLQEDINLDEFTHGHHDRIPKLVLLFVVGLGGVMLASKFVIVSATGIAHWIGIPETVIALTLVALGTSIPEVATSITAARKGQGELAVGNILGANIMNICWVAGASAMANSLKLERKEILFMFPAMFVIVVLTLVSLSTRGTLDRKEGFGLVGLYVLYLAALAFIY
jgi:cation:H+ antiporter